MSHPITQIFFWVSAGIIVYTYLIYPVLLLFLRLFVHHPIRKEPIEPMVSILVPAYNEADVIEAKIKNLRSLDYPKSRLDVVIASDGSTDATAEIAQHHSDGTRFRTLDYKENLGKIGVLNASVPELAGEIVVFSDASAMLEEKAIRQLVANFADPEVGAVSGIYRVVKASEAHLGRAEDFYWKYETFLKTQESELGCVVGGHGQILAIRKALYPFPDPGIINDDYVIPLRILKMGHRVVYEPKAIAREVAEEMTGFNRRIRVMAGNIQQLREIRELLWPPRLFPLFVFISHKVLRLVVPFAMATLVICNLLLLRQPIYARLGLLQLCFYLLAVAGGWRNLHPKILQVPHYFCMINAAGFVAMYKFLLGYRKVAWK